MSGDNSQATMTTANLACPPVDCQKEGTTTTASLACFPDDLQNKTITTKVPALPCPADNCSKKLKTKKTLGIHMDKFHVGAQNFSNQVRNFLLSPIPGPSSTPDVPPGSAPVNAPPSGVTATPNMVSKPMQL